MALAIVQALLSCQTGLISAIQSASTWPQDTRERKPNNWGCMISGMFKFSVIAYDPTKTWLTPHISLENMKSDANSWYTITYTSQGDNPCVERSRQLFMIWGNSWNVQHTVPESSRLDNGCTHIHRQLTQSTEEILCDMICRHHARLGRSGFPGKNMGKTYDHRLYTWCFHRDGSGIKTKVEADL